MSIIYFVRHGECVGNVSRSNLAPGDDTLTFKGKLQAKKLGEKLQNEIFTRVYSSPYARTMETAQLILSMSWNSSEVPILEDRRLRERDLGLYKRKSHKEILYDVLNSGKLFVEFEENGVETVAEMDARVENFFEEVFSEIDRSASPETILAVTHAATILHIWNYLPRHPNKYTLNNWKSDYYKSITPNTGYFKISVEKCPPPGQPRKIEILTAHGREHLKTFDGDTLHKATLEDEFKQFRGCVQQ